MKRILLFLLCCFLLTSCMRKDPAPAATTPTSAATLFPAQSFLVYYGDENAEKLLCKEVQVAQINTSAIIEQLISAGVLCEGVAVNELEQNGTSLVVDFNQTFADLICSMGTSGEYIIVGSTVNTFLNAFHAQSMTFTINGEILESGHVIYDFPMEFME